MQPSDLARLVTVGDPAVSPDGLHVTVTVTRVDVDANRYRSAIWLVPASPDDGTARPLTSGDGSDRNARWSPDATRIAFSRTTELPDRTERSELCILPADGPGEAVVIAASDHAITSIDWSPDGERLAWCTRVPDPGTGPGVDERDREPRRIDTLYTRLDDVGWVVDRPTQVFVGRADRTEPPRQVTTGRFEHLAPRWSPDGRSLALCAARHDRWDVDVVNDVWLVDADDPGAELRCLTGTDRRWSALAWSPDGTRVAAIAIDERDGFRNGRAYVVDVATGKAVDVAPTVDRHFAPHGAEQPPVWLDDDTVLVAREDRGRFEVVRVAADGLTEPSTLEHGGTWIHGFDARAGRFAIVDSTPANPGELVVDGVLRTNAQAAFLRACPPLPVERFSTPSPAGDDDIDAWFVAPPGAPGDGSVPLLVSVHGGPMTQYGDHWFDEWQLWASAGFAVVGCNPHGSSGQEEAWARAIRSPLAELDPGTGWGGVDADDIVAVLDATLARWPWLDRDRVGIHGGSYGGFMASWLCARTDRFVAGCSERAVNNLLSEEWSSDVGGTFWRELGVSHLDHPEEYLRMSPATYVRDITCPMLLLHSEQDLRCNIEQADALFVALRLLGKDVEYWRFPGESHELSRSGNPKHRIRRAELIVDFFRRRL